MTGKDLEGRWDVCVPEAFQEQLAKRVCLGYKAAFREANRKPEAQAHNLLPFLRWSQIDVEMAKAGRRFRRDGMKVETLMNKGGYNYVQVISGRIILTASSVRTAFGVPRAAQFRETLARDSRPFLFPEMEQAAPDEASLYAILTHAHNPNNPRLPWFANIRFPLPDCRRWAPGKIALFDKYPSIVHAKRSFQEEEIEDQILTQLREDADANAAKSKIV